MPRNEADPGTSVDVRDPRIAAEIQRYWRRNVRVMAVLLVVWAFAGLGCGVLLADALNTYRIGGFPLGFWFAQQGSIVVFVLLVLVYALALNRLDALHHRALERIRGRSAGRDA
jgi:putative solute:sodium symporter small subunit